MTTLPPPTGSSLLHEIGRVLRFWPAVLASGVVTVVAGVFALALPWFTALTAGVLFGIAILLQGVLFAAVAFGAKPQIPGRVWLGVWGVLSVVIGFFAIIHPWTGALALAYLLIFWFFLSAVTNIIRATSATEHRVWFGVIGALELIVAIWLAVDILAAVDTVALIVAFGLLLRGTVEIALAFRLRHVGKVLTGNSEK